MAAELGVSAVSVNGTNGARLAESETSVYYVPLDKEAMLRVQHFYEFEDSYITRANTVRSDLAFGSGFYLELAGKNKVMPDQSYDYTQSIKTLLEKARRLRDMVGFAAFVQRNDSAQDEINRQIETQATGEERGAEEIAAAHIEHCENRIAELAPNFTLNGRKRKSSAMEPAPEEDPSGGEAAAAREESIGNGTSLTASDARLLLEKTRAKSRRIRQRAQSNTQKLKSIQEMLISIESVQIIELSQGQFYLEIDNLLHTRRVVWAPARRQPLAPASITRTASGHLRTVDYDPNVTVYVWRMPTDSGHIRTDFLEIIRLREMVLEAENNAMDADYQTSHPVPFVQHGRGTNHTKLEDLPEEEIYGEHLITKKGPFDKDTMSATDMQTYRRDMRASILMEERVANFNESALIGRAARLAEGNVRRTRATGAYGKAGFSFRQNILEEAGIMELPSGLTLGGQVSSSTTIDLKELRAQYDMRLSTTIGVPLTYLQGQQMNSSALTENGSNSNSTLSSIMRTTIATDREQMSRFFDELYETLFHDVDNEALSAQLEQVLEAKSEIEKTQLAYEKMLQKRYDIAQRVPIVSSELNSLLSEAARICAIESELHRVASLKHRLRLKFVKAPFVEAAEVKTMYEAGAISHLEMVNLLRQNAGIEKLDEKGAEKIFEENLNRTQLRQAASAPPPAPTAKSEPKEVKSNSTKGSQQKTT